MENKQSLTIILILILMIAVLILAIWLDLGRADASELYQTPVSLHAAENYKLNQPIKTPEQAILAARKQLTTSRVRFTNDPLPSYVKRTTYRNAIELIKIPNETGNISDMQKDDNVWVVIFQGDYWIDFCPDGDCPTPQPGEDIGCAYVILNSEDGESYSMGARNDCPVLPGRTPP